MAVTAITISRDNLEVFSQSLLLASGVSATHADIVAKSLIAANLRGVDSHGVQLLSYYLKQIEAKNIVVDSIGAPATESGATMVYDAANGLGAVTANECCGHANRLAAEHGIGMVTAKNANHFGACAFWAQRISAARNIGIVVCNASPLVAPWQGKEVRFGTNPICMAIPGGKFLLDMATTTVAANRIYKAVTNQEPSIPLGWAMDREGRPTTDPKVALDGGFVMPLGGYKGYGLAIMVEILCALLSGGAMSTELGGIRVLDRPMNAAHMFLAISVDRFLPGGEFEPRMAKLIGMLKSAEPAAGFSEVLVAGEPEERIEADRLANGIPIETGVWARLCEDGNNLRVAIPQ